MQHPLARRKHRTGGWFLSWRRHHATISVVYTADGRWVTRDLVARVLQLVRSSAQRVGLGDVELGHLVEVCLGEAFCLVEDGCL